MLLPKGYDAATWHALFDALDDRLQAATQRYVRSHFLGATDIASGFSELASLANGHEPDYSVPGVAVAYAFAYLPRRIACILGAFTLLSARELPRRLLDIGSGSGATSIALGLLNSDTPIQIDAVEPSYEMRRFAAEFPLPPNISVRHIPGRLEDIDSGKVKLDTAGYDLITMSACLPYSERDREPPISWLRYVPPPPLGLMAMEPEVKHNQIEFLARGAWNAGGYDAHLYCCHDLPRTVRLFRKLERTTKLLEEYYPSLNVNPHLSLGGRQLIGRPPYPVRSWNEHREVKESILVCRAPANRAPALHTEQPQTVEQRRRSGWRDSLSPLKRWISGRGRRL